MDGYGGPLCVCRPAGGALSAGAVQGRAPVFPVQSRRLSSAGEDAVGVEFAEVFAVLEVSVDQLEVDGTPQSFVVEVI